MIILILLIFGLLFCCTDKRAKVHYKGTNQIRNNLYVDFYEPYRGGAGVFAGSVHSAHLTDSMGMNIFLGSYDDHDGFDFFVDSTQFKAKKYTTIFMGFNEFPKKKYIDSVIVDLKTKKRIK